MMRLYKLRKLPLILTVSIAFSLPSQAQYITTIGGTGSAGYNGDGIAATTAQLNNPRGVAVDKDGNVYVADMWNHRVRKISSTGSIITVAGTGTQGNTGDGSAATSAQLSFPRNVALDTAGNLYIRSGAVIRKVNKNGMISTVAGNGSLGYSGENINATAASLAPEGICVDRAGNIYIAEDINHRVRKVNTSGVISTIAGTGTAGYNGDNMAATSAQINGPRDVCVDTLGNIYIADFSNHRVRMINTSGNIATIAGTGTAGYSGDYGTATGAMLNGPMAVATDENDVYVADLNNMRIRKITGGKIIPLVGNGANGYNGDGQLPLSASLATPTGIAVSRTGTVYFADLFNHRVRMASAMWYRDYDADGFGKSGITRQGLIPPPGYAANSIDCNDSSANQAQWGVFGQAGFSKGTAAYTDMTIDKGDNPLVVYSDGAYSNKATVMSYAGGAWSAIGTEGFTAGSASFSRVAVGANDTPYILFRDGANSFKSTVMKFDGSNWITVGTAGFGTAIRTTGNTVLVLDGSGTPYVGFIDVSNNISIMKYTGGNWISLGSPGANINAFNAFIDLAIDAAGTPYVAFADGTSINKETVMKFDGTNWVLVGSAGFSSGAAFFSTLAIDSSGFPYVAYSDGGSSLKIAVKKYNGTSWVNVGAQSFSTGAANDVSLDFDNRGTLYVAFRDAGNGNKATVMKFSSGFWIPVGTTGFTTGAAGSLSLVVDRKGIPYVCFMDGAGASPDKASAMSISVQSVAPTKPTFSGNTKVCKGTPAVIEINGGSLNDGNHWQWFTGSCGGTSLSTNKSIAVTPPVTTTYYARAEGPCLLAPGVCDSIKLTIDPILPHSVSLSVSPDSTLWMNGVSVTFTANTTNSGATPTYEWYKNGVIVTGVTGTTYNAGPVQENDQVCVNVLTDADCAQPALVSSCAKIHLDLGVNRINNDLSVRVFPNPNNGTFTINGNVQINEPVELQVTNTFGQVVFRERFNAIGNQLNKQLNLDAAVANGIYMLRVKSGNTVSNTSFLVQR